jgi:hypothetical protein
MMLQFDDALLCGTPPAPPPGCVRLLAQSLSPGASRAYATCTAQWRAQMAAAKLRRTPSDECAPTASQPPLPWAQLLSPLGDCLAEEEHVLDALRMRLQLPKARPCAQRRASCWRPHESARTGRRCARAAARGRAVPRRRGGLLGQRAR